MLTSITGIISFILLILVMVPPLRLTWIERTVASLPRAYRLHHVVGVAAVVVGALHAGIAMFPYLAVAGSVGEALSFFLDPSDALSFLGSLALLLLLLVAVVASIRPALPRRSWLWVHRLSLPAFVLAGAHVLVAWDGSLAPDERLADVGRLALAAAGGAALLALGVHFVRPEWLATHHGFAVTQVRPVEPGVVELTLRRGRGRGAWRSGAFGFFRFDCHGPCGVTHERHPFTVVDVSSRHELRVVVKALGDDTARLQKIMVGTPGEVTGPYGALEVLLARPTRQVWLAGGLGVLPFLGLARRRAERRRVADDVVLLYLHRPGQKALFLDELQQLAASRAWLRVIPIESAPGDAIDLTAVESIVADWRRREWAIAGPHAMVERWSALLRSKGLPRSKIFTEDYLT
jgi:predicted ferric reductase